MVEHAILRTGLTYSIRLVRPFLQVLAAHPGVAREALEQLMNLGLDERIPIDMAHAMLEQSMAQTGDPHLGLKAGRAMSMGDTGALDYAMGVAANVREALEVAARYIALVNEALEVHLDIEGERTLLRLESLVPMPKGAADFMMSGLYVNQMRILLQGASDVVCWFKHATPDDVSAYVSTFAPATLRFGAAYYGFSFPSRHLDALLERADPKLGSVLRQHAERVLASRPRTESLTDKVCVLLTDELRRGNPTAASVANRLGLSVRTLGRKLQTEGSTFAGVLDDLRKRLALQYIAQDHLGLAEVAFLVGFAQPTAFHRAFKRWTGKTPLEYRRGLRSWAGGGNGD